MKYLKKKEEDDLVISVTLDAAEQMDHRQGYFSALQIFLFKIYII
jgi:hypothetical protein